MTGQGSTHAGSFLVHGGGSGIGTAAMALAKEAKVRCLVTAGSDKKCEQCRQLGAFAAINYKEHNFAEEVHKVEEVCNAACRRLCAALRGVQATVTMQISVHTLQQARQRSDRPPEA